MSIFLMGRGQITEVREHRGSVEVKATCYRATHNGIEHAEMPPRATFAEAESDMIAFCQARRDAEGGMVSYSLPMRAPKKVLSGIEEDAV